MMQQVHEEIRVSRDNNDQRLGVLVNPQRRSGRVLPSGPKTPKPRNIPEIKRDPNKI